MVSGPDNATSLIARDAKYLRLSIPSGTIRIKLICHQVIEAVMASPNLYPGSSFDQRPIRPIKPDQSRTNRARVRPHVLRQRHPQHLTTSKKSWVGVRNLLREPSILFGVLLKHRHNLDEVERLARDRGAKPTAP
jgi:hypothetical protein